MNRSIQFAWAIVCAGILSPLASGVPVAQESIPTEGQGGYPREWPAGPAASSVPDWARPATFSFSRWDGGPIETAKAFLSGWPGMNPPVADNVYVMTNWYDPSTVRFLREAHISLVWVTFSNGFSIPSEQVQRDLLRVYIAECHRYGIHVLAYESVANMFWEDMYKNVPQSKHWIAYGKDGKPVPYGAGDYSKMGRVTRYMADLSNPEWRAYLMKRVDLAVEAGADGIMYDNVLVGTTMDTVKVFQDIMRHALTLKPDFLIEANFHRNNYILNRVINCMTTEDGGEAGIFPSEHLFAGQTHSHQAMQRALLLPVNGGFLVNHVGLFRTFENLSGGWKPAMIESNLREQGTRETAFMAPQRQKLATAEPMMYGVVNEGFVELRFSHDLWRAQPDAVAAWRAVGQYNRFFADNKKYYRGARSVADLAIVLDSRSEGQDVMSGLAARNVLFNVLYEDQVTPAALKPYGAVALLAAETVRPRAVEALRGFVNGGGALFAAGAAATKDEAGNDRGRPDWFEGRQGDGTAVYWKNLPAIDELARILKSADRSPLVTITAPPGVLYNVTQQTDSGRLMVHLLNYLPNPVQNISVSVTGKYGKVSLLTPDESRDEPKVDRQAAMTVIRIPSLAVYSVLVLNKS